MTKAVYDELACVWNFWWKDSSRVYDVFSKVYIPEYILEYSKVYDVYVSVCCV